MAGGNEAAAPRPSLDPFAAAARLRSAWPLAAVLAWLAATAWFRSFSLPDEGRYAGVAWSMLTSGNWLVPHLDGLPYFHKPPLYYWITLLAMRAFGPVEWAARIAPLLGAMAGASALWLFLRRWRSELHARWALAALASQVLVFMGAQFANLDMLVAGCITVTVFALAHAVLLREEGGDPGGALLVAYLFAALGVLAKGLIGAVLPALVLLAWLLLQRRPRLIFTLLWWPGLLLFLLVAAPWFVLMQARFPGFLNYFFYVQHFARFAGDGFNNQQPVYFYPVILLGLCFPWSLWALAKARRHPVPGSPAARLRSLYWTWLLVVTIFFSLPRSKPIGYIMPAAWPLALLATEAFAASQASGRLLRWRRASLVVAAACCLGAVGYGALHPLHSTRAIGLALRQAGPGDPVLFLHNYWFDVPLYARMRRPVTVLDAWNAPSPSDGWRKELSDAALFDGSAARKVLLMPADASALLCGPGQSWLVGEAADKQQYPMLAAAETVAVQGRVLLWRMPARSGARAGCA